MADRRGSDFCAPKSVRYVVSCPANVDAVSLAKSLNVSDAMLREVFRDMPQKPLSVGERIRQTRRATVAKARRMLQSTKDPKNRQTLMRCIAILEQEDRENLAASMQLPETHAQKVARAKAVRARAEKVIADSNAREVRDRAEAYANSPAGQQQLAYEQTVAGFTAAAAAHADAPKPVIEPQVQTWRGVKLPGQSWRGRKV